MRLTAQFVISTRKNVSGLFFNPQTHRNPTNRVSGEISFLRSKTLQIVDFSHRLRKRDVELFELSVSTGFGILREDD